LPTPNKARDLPKMFLTFSLRLVNWVVKYLVLVEQNHKIGPNEESSQVEKAQYQQLEGKLIYLSNASQTFPIRSLVWLVSLFMIHKKDIYRQLTGSLNI